MASPLKIANLMADAAQKKSDAAPKAKKSPKPPAKEDEKTEGKKPMPKMEKQ